MVEKKDEFPEDPNAIHRKETSKKKVWITVIKIVCFLIILYFTGTSLVSQLFNIEWHHLNPDWRFLSLALLAIISMRLCAGVFYKIFLVLLGLKGFPTRIAMAVSWISVLGRYVPGKVAIIANVVYLLRRYQVRTSFSVMIPILSNCMIVLIALIISTPVLFLPWAQERVHFSPLWLVVLGIAIGVAIWPRVFIGFTNRVLLILGRPILEFTLTFKQMMIPSFLVVAQCFFSGAATWCIIKMISPLMTLSLFPMVISITALSGCMGVVVLFAPAGLGVVEGIYLIALSPLVGPEIAALSAVLIRLLHTILDIVMALAGMLILKRDRQA